MTLLKRRMTKTVGGVKFLASDFAFVGDEQKPDTWRLRLAEKAGGEPTRKMVDQAIKNFGNMMGQPSRYHIPDDALDSIVDKLREAWSMAYPHKAPADMPEEIAPEEGDPMAAAAGEEEPMLDEEGNPIEEEADPAAEGEEEEVDPAAEGGEEDDEDMPPKRKPGKKPVPEGSAAGSRASFTMGKAILEKYYYVDPTKGAQSFSTILAECKKDQQHREAVEAAYPLLNSLDGSLRSIVGDKEMDKAAKQTMMRSSVEGFLAAIREEWPEIEEALEKALLNSPEGAEYMKRVIAKSTGGTEGNGFLKQLSAQVGDLTKKVEDLTKAAEKATQERDAAIAKAATLETVGKFDGETRKFYDALKSEEEKAEFLKMDDKARGKLVAKSKDDDESIEFDGETIRKSDVGAIQFGIFKRQAAKAAKLEKQLEDEREARVSAEYLAQAEEEMVHLPGTAAEKAAVLRAIDEGIEDEDVRNSLAKMLSVGDKAVSHAYSRLGASDATGTGEDGTVAKRGTHDFEKRITAIKARDNCSHTAAMQRARDEAPDEFEDWQSFNG